mmetsp:Transcript_6648/g.16656  ORF Transcript_6648/g.16656 Transcript_6648/m.16656 type:complete len:318 (-) Transcript_6648:650-1603(-)
MLEPEGDHRDIHRASLLQHQVRSAARLVQDLGHPAIQHIFLLCLAVQRWRPRGQLLTHHEEQNVGDDGEGDEDLKNTPPNPNRRGACGDRPLVHLRELEQVGLDLDNVGCHSKQRGKWERVSEENHVPNLYHHFHEVVELLILWLGKCFQGVGVLRLIRLLQLTFELPKLPLADLFHDEREDRLQQHSAKAVHGVEADELAAELAHVLLHEGDVEEGDVTIEGLEDEALGDQRVLMVLQEPVVLACSQPLCHFAVRGVQPHDHDDVQHRRHEGEESEILGLVRVEQRTWLRKICQKRHVEYPLERSRVLFHVTLQVQ